MEVRVRVQWNKDKEDDEQMDVCFAQDENGRLLEMDRFAPKEDEGEGDEGGNLPPPPTEGILRLYVPSKTAASITLTKITKRIIAADNNIDNDDESSPTSNTPEADIIMQVSKPIWIPEVLYRYEQEQQAKSQSEQDEEIIQEQGG